MDFDIAIVGGGLAGASLAVALRRARLSVAVIEAHGASRPATTWDARVYAVSPANQAFLGELGVWRHLDVSRISAVREMRIKGDARGQLRFSAFEEGLAELAWIVEAGVLRHELWETLRRQHNVELFCPATIETLSVSETAALLTLGDGRQLRARLVVGADGVHSRIRNLAGLVPDITSYHQRGVVANFRCEQPNLGVAYQWFGAEGILAYLPLPGDLMSMVWSVEEAFADELLALSPEALCAKVAAQGEKVLGELSLETPAQAFPLRMLRLKSPIAARLVLIGDAAHAIHPLSGHGINLGFQDARTLATRLEALPHWRDPGDAQNLRAYARSRAEEPFMLQYGTHALNRLFESRDPFVRTIRNLGMNLTASLPVVRSALVRYATGGKF